MVRQGSLTISEFLEYLAPGIWTSVDLLSWPPDVFALVAALLQKSGAYTNLVREWQLDRGRVWCDDVAKIGKAWRNSSTSKKELPNQVSRMWGVVTASCEIEMNSICTNDELCSALFHLIASSDEASHGAGIPPIDDTFEEIARDFLDERATLCKLINPSRLRVLPKLHTPQSGITIRSLTHHLALCPASEVQPLWNILPKDITSEELNLLVLPWPTVVDTNQFRPTGTSRLGSMPKQMQFFSYEPRLEEEFLKRLQSTINNAQLLVEDHIHGVIFPELSLTKANHDIARDEVLKRSAFLISGVHENPLTERDYARNYVALDVPVGEHCIPLTQDKHHRWLLNHDQILQYELQDSLDADNSWWENTEIPERKLVFVSMRPWLTLCVLICEDLARQDPVSDIVRAVGPNLVVALLMDGPQLTHRWAARYATVLADDPGSSVLTVTSLGMAERSRALDDLGNPNPPRSRVVALWKDGVKGTQPIELPGKAEGVILRLKVESREEFSADGRGDLKKTRYPVLVEKLYC
ncbi:MAG TPA: hypothetical protein VEM96_21070 [Pyrinomonadaceae bacterium]|nr:hypothetical protein [Pyrinomonadaceae bacterium]